MPSPRFDRLPIERRALILGVARRHIAAHGNDAASYNQIIAEAGISKTSAYLYFDGKDDLVDAVRRDVLLRLGEVLGPWPPARSVRGFWAQLQSGAARLRQHLVEHPDDLGVLDGGDATADDAGGGDAWLAAMIDDGRRLGVVRRDVAAPIVVAATRALLRIGDAHGIAALRRGEPAELAPLWALLKAMWTPPARRRR